VAPETPWKVEARREKKGEKGGRKKKEGLEEVEGR